MRRYFNNAAMCAEQSNADSQNNQNNGQEDHHIGIMQFLETIEKVFGRTATGNKQRLLQ